MSEKIKEISNTIKDSKSTAICCDEVVSFDLASALVGLILFYEAMGKKASLILINEPHGRVKELFKKYNISYSSDVKPLSYVVSIDYGRANIEKITHETDEKEGKIHFYIVPTQGEFNFENINYSQSGSDFDLTLTFAIKNFKQMANVYDTGDYLFKRNKVVAMARGENSLGDLYLGLDEKDSYSKVVYEIIKSNSSAITEEIINILLEGVVDFYKILEGKAHTESWETIASMVKYGGNMQTSLREVYFSKTFNNLDLQIKMMQNIRVDKSARVIWSSVSQQDLKFCNINEDNLDIKGRIIYNISADFDLVIAAYEVEKDVIKVIVESNLPDKFSAIKIAGVFDGKGDDSHAFFVTNNIPLKEFEKRVFVILSDLYGLNVRFEGITFNTKPVNSDQDGNIKKDQNILTKSQQYSKNTKPSDKQTPNIVGEPADY